MTIKEVDKKILKRAVVVSSVVLIGTIGYNIHKNEKVTHKNDTTSNIINTTDFILGLKKIAQLEYAVGDVLINVNAEDNFYKTFEQNSKYEIFIDKKSEDITSLHYTSNLENIDEADMKYLKNIYNLSFSNMSSYLFDKTIEIIEMMRSNEYISTKGSAIQKNNSVSEVISIGKTSEIKVTMMYSNKSIKNEPVSIDIAILKGNKW